MKRNCIPITAIVGIFVFFGSIVLGWYGFPTIVKKQIINSVILLDGSDAYERWRELPQPIHFKVYIFNVTNADDVDNGEAPILQEVGPFVYEQYRVKYDIRPEANGTLSYNERQTFVYSQRLSDNRSDEEVVTILNMAAVGIIGEISTKYKQYLSMANRMLKDVLPMEKPSAFMTATVRDVLFDGVPVINCSSSSGAMIYKMVKQSIPETVREVEGKIFVFSAFNHKNGTVKGRYNIDRGLKDSSDLGEIVAWENETTIDVWNGTSCNQINGTDSTIFSPFKTTRERVYIYAADICRSLFATFERNSKYEGIPTMRFTADASLLKDADENPDNWCFCNGECFKSGALDLMSCLGVPAVMTFPHFYTGAPEYLDYAQGLSPDKHKHETFMEIEPKSGIPIRGAKRMQMNMFLMRVPELDVLKNVSEGLFPVLWLEEGMVLEEQYVKQVLAIYDKLRLLQVTKWLLVALGIGLMLAAMCGAGKRTNCGRRTNHVSAVSYPTNMTVRPVGGHHGYDNDGSDISPGSEDYKNAKNKGDPIVRYYSQRSIPDADIDTKKPAAVTLGNVFNN